MGQTFHVYPVDDLIAHDTETEDCICGPKIELVPSETGDGWLITHNSLDGREAKENR
ncbi:hypothetical protein [Brachybacterium massiliense]|uniref:hypothetical protein n=1 Tax=Brachybacterium massiliense TaxID=1755098 RepID=UPI001482404B|nr:hypothetical protein [Brachybacterium massiliense]